MTKRIVFIQVHGKPDIIEVELSNNAIVGELHDAMAKLGADLMVRVAP